MPDAPAASARRIRSRTFASLAENPAYRRFYLGQGVSLIGTWLQLAAVSWIVFDMTQSEWMLGVVDAAGTMPGLLVGLVAGAMADRVAPWVMILGMQFAQMALAFLLALLVGLGVVQIWQLALILALTRVCVTFEMPSRQVFLYELVGRPSLMNAIALNSGLFNASRVLGPALAGLCLARFGTTAPFVLNGVSFFAAIAALLTIHVGRRRDRPESNGPVGLRRGFADLRRDLLGGVAYLGHDTRVRSLFLLMTFFGVVGMGYSALIPAYARLVVRTDAVGFSLLLACGGFGATVGALVVASLGGLRRRERLIPAGMLIFSAALVAAGLLPGALVRGGWPRAILPVSSLCLFATGFGAILFYSVTQTLIQTAVPDTLRGRIMGIWMILFSGSVPLGSLWAGSLARSFGVTAVMVTSASLCVVMALLVLAGAGLAEVKHERPGPA
jgi:MFS family permease